MSKLCVTFLTFIAGYVCASDPQQCLGDTASRKWIQRIESNLDQATPERRELALKLIVIRTTELGDSVAAKELIYSHCSPSHVPELLAYVAAAEGQLGKTEDAIATVTEIAPGDTRDRAWWELVNALFGADRICDGARLLERITNQNRHEHALSRLARAYAKRGDVNRARASAERIRSKEPRENALQSIDRSLEAKRPVDGMEENFLRDQVRMLTMFASENTYEDAINAISAAQRGDRIAMSKLLVPALDAAKVRDQPLEPRLVTTLILFAVAAVEIGEQERAQQLVALARQHAGRDWMQVTSTFGNPILAYLMVRLQMNDALEQMLLAVRREEKSQQGSLSFDGVFQAVGAALAESSHSRDADVFYEQLKSADERIAFSIGTLLEIAYK